MCEIKSLGAFTQYLEQKKELEWKPFLFKVAIDEAVTFNKIIEEFGFGVCDQIENQLNEFARIKFPSENDLSEREEVLIAIHREDESLISYGNWAFFGWKNTLVHPLPELEYHEVITNRNKNKITRKEQSRLQGKKVGIVGLSVGAEATMTLAQENLCGELRIADFDTLDLSNLNRINAGVDELGLPKTLITARRIKTLNPYLNVVPFKNGIGERNMNEFLNDLDLIVEECDELRLKYKIREEAKERKINLVFAADEKGFFSIEPYADEKELSLFHGLVSEIPRQKEEYATSHDFMIALCEWLGGWENISKESRGSVLEIGKLLCGYPQLASEAKLAAAQVGHFARRLLLGERLEATYFNIDWNTIKDRLN